MVLAGNFGGLWRGITKFNFGMIFSGVIDVFVGLLELISEVVRLVSFTFRLFGNVFAGEVVILMFTFLIPLVVTLAFYGLEVFVGYLSGPRQPLGWGLFSRAITVVS